MCAGRRYERCGAHAIASVFPHPNLPQLAPPQFVALPALCTERGPSVLKCSTQIPEAAGLTCLFIPLP